MESGCYIVASITTIKEHHGVKTKSWHQKYIQGLLFCLHVILNTWENLPVCISNKATRSPEISCQQVQKPTPPPLSTQGLDSISLFSLIYHTNMKWDFFLTTPPPPTWQTFICFQKMLEIVVSITTKIKYWHPPPPQIKTREWEDIGYRFPLSLSTMWGTTFHLTSC